MEWSFFVPGLVDMFKSPHKCRRGWALGRAGAVTSLSSGTEILGMEWLWEGWGLARRLCRMCSGCCLPSGRLSGRDQSFVVKHPYWPSPEGFHTPRNWIAELCWSVNRKTQPRNQIAKVNGRASGAVPWTCIWGSWLCCCSQTKVGNAPPQALLLCSFLCRHILPPGRSKVWSMKRFNTFLYSPGMQ